MYVLVEVAEGSAPWWQNQELPEEESSDTCAGGRYLDD